MNSNNAITAPLINYFKNYFPLTAKEKEALSLRFTVEPLGTDDT